MKHYQHLGIYSDWVEAALRQQPLYPWAEPGVETRQRFKETLGFYHGPEVPRNVTREQYWEKDGVAGEEVSWWVGFGPRTHAYVLKPVGVAGALPGILALHDHGGFKFYGKEKIADGPVDPLPVLVEYRRNNYGGRAYCNALAQEGFVVVVHDTFLWGSRRFPISDMPQGIQDLVKIEMQAWQSDGVTPYEIAEYHQAAMHHEHLVEKYANLLGTTMAGVVCYEDRIALNYLLTRPDILADRIACMGLSGGGNRAAMLLATHDGIQAAVIVGLMCTYPGLLDHNVQSHTWMLFPHGWACYGDWPDVAASRAPLPLLVQYDMEDDLFPLEGMRAAHERVQTHYRKVGNPDAYTGQFYPGPHKFDLEMQRAAFDWLGKTIQTGVKKEFLK